MASQDAREAAAASSGGQSARVGSSTTGSFSASASTSSSSTSMSSGKRPASGGAQRSAEELRRNGLNMERMIKKNVLAASRPGGMKRGLAVVEYFKNKKSKEQQDGGATTSSSNSTEDADERSAKRRRMLPGTDAPMPPDAAAISSSTPAATQRIAMSPARRPSPGAITAGESLAALMASPQRPQHFRSNPLHLVSPARARAAVAINVSSPARPPRAAHGMTSPLRAVRNGTMASPMRRPGQFLTSPIRPHRTAASPRKPLFQDDDEAPPARPQRLSASAPALESALDQAERSAALARPATTTAASASKSPFHSFQSKFTPKPRQGPSVPLSPPIEAQDTPPSSVEPTKQPVRESKPARSLFGRRSAVANRSMCFSTEVVASSLDVSPDGEIVVVGFTDGSVRLYEMDSNVPSDRYGYLLGHIDEESTQSTGNVNLRVKITPDGRYIFVGCRTGPKVVMSVNLDHYRNEKDDVEDDFEQFQKSFLSDTKVRGFADATNVITPAGVKAPDRHSYYLLFGLGVGTLRMWQFVEGPSGPEWNYLQSIVSGGNTAHVAAFIAPPMLPDQQTSGDLSVACIAEDRNLRVWSLAYSEGSSGEDSTPSHMPKSHFDVPNTKDLIAVYGSYAYGISYGEAYRFRVPLTADAVKETPRQSFEMEKFDTGGSGKSRRSKMILESAFASDDGQVLVAVSTEGVFYYSNSLSTDAKVTPKLRIIGKNSSLNQQYKAPMKVYVPLAKATATSSSSYPPREELQSMMAVVCNPSDDDDDDEGFFNVDPTEVFASRWMVPSRGADCWVCGVRNTCHWQSPPDQHKSRKPNSQEEGRRTRSGGDDGELSDREPPRRSSKTRKSKESDTPTPSRRPKAKPKKSPAAVVSVKRVKAANAVIDGGDEDEEEEEEEEKPSVSATRSRPRLSMASGGGNTGEEDSDESVEQSTELSTATLAAELAHYKDRLTRIEGEWKRRLKGEIQMRRRWKQRENEFHAELHELLLKLDAAETQAETLAAAQKDAEKRFSFEKLKAEQQSSVRARYERLCEQMDGKLALVEDQRRLLEQTTRSLLLEVDRNVQSLQSAVGIERAECVVCKDSAAVTAVVPCGHLCFCEADGESYRRNAPGPTLLCPVCQGDLVSLLRVY